MKTAAIGLFVLMCACLALAACGGGGKSSNEGKPGAKKDTTVRLPVPKTFADMKPTTALDDAAFIKKGSDLFHDAAKANCLMCHGETGKGDGPMAANYTNPAVPDLTVAAFHDSVTDQYIYWRIKDVQGSKADKNSGMLGYQNGTPEEIWSLVAYVRSLKGK